MAFPTGYTKYQEITIDHTKVAADLTDYIVYVNLADLVKTGADIFDTCRTDGGDIRATKTDGTTELAVEVVAIDTTAKTGEIHIKFSGTLSSSTDTVIRIWYNGTDTLPAATDTYGRNAVWSDYAAVFHFDDTTDSKAGDNTLTAFNSPTYSSGKMGNAVDLERSSSQYLRKTSPVNMPASNAVFSMSFWTRRESNNYQLLQHMNGRNYIGFQTTGGNSYFLSSIGDDESWGTTSDYLVPGLDTWFKFKTVREGASSSKVYVDGTLLKSFTNTWGTSASSDLYIGAYITPSDYYDGMIDEFRIKASADTANWETTEYNNQNSPSTFYSVGNELGGSTIVSPAVQSLTFSLPQETITAGAVLPVNAQAITFSIPAYAVSGKALVSVNAQTATFSIPTYMLIANGISLSPNAQALTFSIPTYSVLSGAVLDVGVSTLTFSVPTATITGGATLGVNTQSLTFTIPTLAFIGALWRRSARATSGADWTRSAINND